VVVLNEANTQKRGRRAINGMLDQRPLYWYGIMFTERKVSKLQRKERPVAPDVK
jgi:hypothetical protein